MGQQPCSSGDFNSGPVNQTPWTTCVLASPIPNTTVCNISDYDDGSKSDLLPIVKVRFNFHFIEQNGNGNFTSDPNVTSNLNGSRFINRVLNDANNELADMEINNLYENVPNSTVDYIGDSRIRFQRFSDPNEASDIHGGVWYWDNVDDYNNFTSPYDNVINVAIFAGDANDPSICGSNGNACNGGGQINFLNWYATVFNIINNPETCSSASWGVHENGRTLIHETFHDAGLCHSFGSGNNCNAVAGDLNAGWECQGEGGTGIQNTCGNAMDPPCTGWGNQGSNNFMNYGSGRRSLSRCQWSIVYRNIASGAHNLSDICEVDETPLIISAGVTETWNNTVRFIKNKEIILETGANLNILSSQIRLAQNTVIKVKRGAKLFIDNSTLTNICNGERWGGIYVEGNSQLNQPDVNGTQAANQAGIANITNSTLTHGSFVLVNHRANESWNSDYYGGLILCNGVNLIDNKKAAAFYRYQRRDNSEFINCNINATTGGVFSPSSTQGISVWSCIGIDFIGNTFNNLDYGIVAYNSEINIERDNEFTDLDIGVDIYSTHPNASRDEIGNETYEDGNYFANNQMHIRLAASNGGGLSDIRHNYFDGPGENDAIHLDGEHSVGVYSNFFNDSYVNFNSLSSGRGLIAYECNEMSNTHVSLWAQGQNDLLLFNANFFETDGAHVLLTNRGSVAGSVFEIQGFIDPNNSPNPELNESQSPSNSFPGSEDIITLNNTVHFRYVTPNLSSAVFTPTVGSYNFTNTTQPITIDDCEDISISRRLAGKPPYSTTKLSEMRTAEADTKAESEAELENMDKKAIYAQVSREKEKVLNWLVTEAVSEQDYTQAETFLALETGKHHLRQSYGVKVKSGDYIAAQTKLQTLPNEDTFDAEFIALQEINLNWLQSGVPPASILETSISSSNNEPSYYLSPQRYSFLKNLAHSDSPNSGGAQALLAIITGERFIPESKLKLYPELYENQAPENTSDDLFSIVPNPANGQFSVLGLKEDAGLSMLKVELFSMTGNLVSTFSLPDYAVQTTFKLNNNTTRGVYIVRISDKNQILHQEKLVVLD